MAGKGGYQRPAAPAPVSGPGRLARRTDGGPAQPVRELPNANYGEAAEFRGLQQASPLPRTAAVPSASSGGAAAVGGGGPSVIPFDAESQNPDQPVTAGAPLGAGPGLAELGLPDPNDDLRARLWAAYQMFPTEDLRELLESLDGD
jgi:hypothetical protein